MVATLILLGPRIADKTASALLAHHLRDVERSDACANLEVTHGLDRETLLVRGGPQDDYRATRPQHSSAVRHAAQIQAMPDGLFQVRHAGLDHDETGVHGAIALLQKDGLAEIHFGPV